MSDEIGHEAALAVELVHVSKHYGQTKALDDVSLGVRQGEFYTLLGPSGCGKTTTLNIVAGFIPVTSGQLYVNGKLMHDDPPHRRNVNTVFQNYALFPHLTVAQNIGFGPRMRRTPQPEIEQRVEEMLRLISLEGFGQRYPRQLSGGQQQRVALARALINKPAVLLLDEPLGALDLKIRKQLQVELANIQRRVGITFVYVTHDQEEALALSDRIAVMNQGRILQEGSPTEIYRRPATRFVAHFIGESNFFAARVREVRPGEVSLEMPGFSQAHAPHGGTPLQAGDDVVVMVRPEHLQSSRSPLPAADNVARGRVREETFMGMYTRLVAQIGEATVTINRPPGEESGEGEIWLGQEIYVRWAPQHGIVLHE